MNQRPYNSFHGIFYLFVLISCIYSCSKHHDTITQSPIIPGKDSSLLIKSIRYASKFVEAYYYDSINHKIILTSVTEDSSFPSQSTTELFYNNERLISKIVYKFKQAPASDTTSIVRALFTYDNQNILQKIEQRDFNGLVKITVFTKKLLIAGNYSLRWLDRRSTLPDGTPIADSIEAVFNPGGELISMINKRPYPVNGSQEDTLTTATITTDSIIYDGQGSISQIQSSYTDTLRKIDDHFLYFQFTSRYTEGNNLYNQRQLVLKGIANIPLTTTILSGEAGILSIFNDVHSWQYAKYPFQTAILHNQMINTDEQLSSTAEYDSKNRLTYFKGFLLGGERPLQYPYTNNFMDFHIAYFQ